MKFNSIQELRAWAVLSVVVLHSQEIAPHLTRVPFFSDFGWLGVRLFFVISGFIIAERIGRETSLKTYLLRRYLRVFPLYALVTLVAFALSVAIDSAIFTAARTEDGSPFVIGNLFSYVMSSMFIVPQDRWPFFMVGWSLEYEVVFYVTFGCAFFLLNRKGALAIMVILSAVGALELPFVRTFFDSFFLYFLVGCLAREAVRLEVPHGGRLAGCVCTASALLTGLHLIRAVDLSGLGFVVASAICFGSLIVFVVDLERRTSRYARRTALVLIGDMSFSIYLVHWLVFPLAGIFSADLQLISFEAEIFRLVCVSAVLGLSWLVWRFVERPLNKAFRPAQRVGLRPAKATGMTPAAN